MKPEHALALVLIPVATVAGSVVASWFQRVRDLFFFLMVTLSVMVERPYPSWSRVHTSNPRRANQSIME